MSNIKIVYSSGTTINVNYKVLYANNQKILSNYFEIPDNNNINPSFQFFKPKINLFDTSKTNKLNDMKWDFKIDDGKLKCIVDDLNKVNVIFQNTFLVSNIELAKQLLDNCFSTFDDNDYPIIVIEALNAGGYVGLADYFISYINLYKTSSIYSSLRYNENIKSISSNFEGVDIETCQIKKATKFFNLKSIEDDYGIDQNGAKIKHKRTQIFDESSNDKRKFFDFRENAKHIRKPNEIIIFTDGLSYSATSIFIKETQIMGGAIIVGYNGNPKLASFDSSQGLHLYFQLII